MVDRLGAALGLRRVVLQVAGLVDGPGQPDQGDLAPPSLAPTPTPSDGGQAGGHRVHALVQRPAQQRLGGGRLASTPTTP